MSPLQTSLGLFAISVFLFSFYLHVENALAEETDWAYTSAKRVRNTGGNCPRIMPSAPTDRRNPRSTSAMPASSIWLILNSIMLIQKT